MLRSSTLTHGQPEKETSAEDVEAQAPQAPQSESAQEAHVAEIEVIFDGGVAVDANAGWLVVGN